MDNPAFIIFAALSPLLIAFLKQAGFSRTVNAMIALACYIVIGALAALLSGGPFTVENAVNLIAVAVVVGRASYELIWTNIGVTPEAPGGLDQRLTAATSIIK